MQEVFVPIEVETVEAVPLTDENMRWAASWCKGYLDIFQDNVLVPTLQGPRILSLGNYLVRKRCGDFIVMAKIDFERKYKKKVTT